MTLPPCSASTSKCESVFCCCCCWEKKPQERVRKDHGQSNAATAHCAKKSVVERFACYCFPNYTIIQLVTKSDCDFSPFVFLVSRACGCIPVISFECSPPDHKAQKAYFSFSPPSDRRDYRLKKDDPRWAFQPCCYMH